MKLFMFLYLIYGHLQSVAQAVLDGTQHLLGSGQRHGWLPEVLSPVPSTPPRPPVVETEPRARRFRE